MQQGGSNDNTEWKWVWKHGGNAESVAKKGYGHSTRVLRHQCASTPKCYDIYVLWHQSATASKWDTTKVVPPA